MPNHFHGLIFINEKSPPISKFIQNAKRFLAYGIVKQLEYEQNRDKLNNFKIKADPKKHAKHKIFEDRFDSKLIETEKLFLEKLNYIHNNPCVKKWHLADYPENFPFSSASNYLLGKGIYAVDVIQWKNFVRVPNGDSDGDKFGTIYTK